MWCSLTQSDSVWLTHCKRGWDEKQSKLPLSPFPFPPPCFTFKWETQSFLKKKSTPNTAWSEFLLPWVSQQHLKQMQCSYSTWKFKEILIGTLCHIGSSWSYKHYSKIFWVYGTVQCHTFPHLVHKMDGCLICSSSFIITRIALSLGYLLLFKLCSDDKLLICSCDLLCHLLLEHQREFPLNSVATAFWSWEHCQA